MTGFPKGSLQKKFAMLCCIQWSLNFCLGISGGAGTRILGTRPEPDFLGLTEPDFSRSGMYPSLPEPDLMKQNIKFGVNSA